MERWQEFVPALGAMLVAVLILFGVDRLLRRWQTVARHQVRQQSVMLALTAAAVVVVILLLPISESLRGQVLSFVAILLSAAIALSSTTFLGNALAGLMLRSIRNFRLGDFIRVGDHFGRVSERGLFHTEIQTEDRDLTTIPNLYLVTQPVTTVHSSGTIISATVSLGYDVPRTRVRELLLEAAVRAELEEPFVQVLELGDFSVTYRIAGLLTEVKQVLSARSFLRSRMLDTLHEGGVEIVSPTFMNTRAFEKDSVFIPSTASPAESEVRFSPEGLVFDKAEQAASLEALRSARVEVDEKLHGLAKELAATRDEEEARRLQSESAALELRARRIETLIEQREDTEGRD